MPDSEHLDLESQQVVGQSLVLSVWMELCQCRGPGRGPGGLALATLPLPPLSLPTGEWTETTPIFPPEPPVLGHGKEPTARLWGDICNNPQDSWPLLFLDIQLLCGLGVVVVGMGVHIRAGPPSSPWQVIGQACRDPAPAAGGGPQLRPQVTRASQALPRGTGTSLSAARGARAVSPAAARGDSSCRCPGSAFSPLSSDIPVALGHGAAPFPQHYPELASWTTFPGVGRCIHKPHVPYESCSLTVRPVRPLRSKHQAGWVRLSGFRVAGSQAGGLQQALSAHTAGHHTSTLTTGAAFPPWLFYPASLGSTGGIAPPPKTQKAQDRWAEGNAPFPPQLARGPASRQMPWAWYLDPRA